MAPRKDMMQAKMMSFQARSAVSTVEMPARKLHQNYHTSISPVLMDGICSIRSVEPGELVSAGQVLLTLVDPKSAYLRALFLNPPLHISR